MLRILSNGLVGLAAAAIVAGLGASQLAAGGPGATSMPAASGLVLVADGEACWYAVFQCAKKKSGIPGTGYVIHTNDFPGFRSGWWCKVLGPYGEKWEAQDAATQWGGYAKSGC